MEKLRHCPICFEVPEQEIFQCSAGHVLCHLCLSKVSGGLCPQCRVAFGATKIRSRIFEEILDTQEFECKFADKGCTHFCKRGEISNHAKACSFNPNTVPLCEQLGLKGCKFRIGKELTRAEIINHFGNSHSKRSLDLGLSYSWLLFSAEEFMKSFNNRKRKADDAKIQPIKLFRLAGLENSETSPLFVIYGKLNHPVGFLSLFGIKIWESGSQPSKTYNAEFKLTKATSSRRSSSENTIDPFPIGGSMKMCGLKEAHRILTASPINIAMSLLIENGFGDDEDDYLRVKISEMTAS